MFRLLSRKSAPKLVARAFATAPGKSTLPAYTRQLAAGALAVAAGTYFWTSQKSQIQSDVTFAPVFPVSEVMKHNSLDDCWIAIEGHVYDVSEFLRKHPGGAARIFRFAGSDATSAFRQIHTPSVLNTMKDHITYLGPLGDGEFVIKLVKPKPKVVSDTETVLGVDPNVRPPLSQIFNLLDFESVAKRVLPQTTFTYYATGASDEFSLRENHYAYSRVFFRPKALRNVDTVSTGTSMLGIDAELPLYISGFAGSCLAHEDAEWNLQKAAYREKIVQMVPRQNLIEFDEFFAGVPQDQQQWAQMHFYLTEEMEDMDTYLAKFHSKPSIKALFFNVDVVDLGNREKDTKVRAQDDEMLEELKDIADNGVVQYCRTFTWDHVKKLVEKSKLPIGLKGVQRGEDVVQAAQLGVKAVVLSNHGGRQLDFSRPPLEVLAEARLMLKEKGLENDIEIYLDGGVRRGSDIVKALCLGASGVGLGRPFLYAMAGYGEEGVVKAIKILKGEVRNNMMLLGARSVAELDESFIDASSLKFRNPNINDRLYDTNYQALSSPPWPTE